MKEITISKEFVTKANELLSKLLNDSAIKTRLLKEFNKDVEFIKESLALGNNARSAEDVYEKETTEAAAAKEDFEKKYKAAGFIYTKHTSLLKLLWKYDIKKQLALGLSGREEPKNKEAWLENALDVYDKIIGDSSAVTLIGGYNITLADMKSGRQAIVEAQAANDTLGKESEEAKEAMYNKEYTLNELYDRMQIIQWCCYYIYYDDPKKFKELGLPIIDNDSGALITIRLKDMVKDSSITKRMKKAAIEKEK